MTSITALDTFIQSNPDARELKRALAVKMEHAGYSHQQIGEVLNVSVAFVTKWKRRFLDEGIDSLRLAYPGFQPYLDASQRQQVLDWLHTREHHSVPELSAYVRDTFGVTFQSKQSYYDLFVEAKISWKKSQPTNPKADPQQVEEKREEVKKNWQPGSR
jgi:putative transposase